MRRWHRHSAAVTRTRRWKALRLEVLRRDGFQCRQCGARGRLEVDHIAPVRDRPDLAYALDNLQSLCPSCHARKTRVEIGLGPRNQDREKWREAVREIARPPD